MLENADTVDTLVGEKEGNFVKAIVQSLRKVASAFTQLKFISGSVKFIAFLLNSFRCVPVQST